MVQVIGEESRVDETEDDELTKKMLEKKVNIGPGHEDYVQSKPYDRIRSIVIKVAVCYHLSESKFQQLVSNFDVFLLDKEALKKGRSFFGEWISVEKKHSIFKNRFTCSTHGNYVFLDKDTLDLGFAVINTHDARSLFTKHGSALAEISNYYPSLERYNPWRQSEGVMTGFGIRGGYEKGITCASYVHHTPPPVTLLLQIESFMEDLCSIGTKYFPEMWKRFDGTARTLLPGLPLLPGCFYPSATFMINYTSMAHHDADCNKLPAIGFWFDADCEDDEIPADGEFVLTQWNVWVPFHKKGTVIIWFANDHEHATAQYADPNFPNMAKQLAADRGPRRIGISMQITQSLLRRLGTLTWVPK